MMHFIHDVPDHVIAVSVDGKLTEDDYAKFNQMIRLKDHSEKLRLYIEIKVWEGMTFHAFTKIKCLLMDKSKPILLKSFGGLPL